MVETTLDGLRRMGHEISLRPPPSAVCPKGQPRPGDACPIFMGGPCSGPSGALLCDYGCTTLSCSSRSTWTLAKSRVEPCGDVTCPTVGTKVCPGDTPISQSDVDACNKQKSDPRCGTAYTTVLACAYQNISCGPDGKDDTSRFQSACKLQVDDLTRCLSGH